MLLIIELFPARVFGFPKQVPAGCVIYFSMHSSKTLFDHDSIAGNMAFKGTCPVTA